MLKEVLKRANIDEKFLPVRELKGKISDAKNKLMGPDEWFQQSEKDYRCQMIHGVFLEYETRLKANNALDFDDLLVKTLELLVDHPPVLDSYRKRFRYVMVDESQDTNYAQYMMIKLLTDESRNLCVVGDDDQSIYGWRGADIRNILDFEKDYPDATVIKLEQNYRSTANILDAANQVIAHNAGRKEKALWTTAGEGESIRLFAAGDERDEAAWIADRIRQMNRQGDPYGNAAILYRTNAQSRVIERALTSGGLKDAHGNTRAGIPYRIYGGLAFYQRKEVKDAICYLRMALNPDDTEALKRVINYPARGIGATTVGKIHDAAVAAGVSDWQVVSDPAGFGVKVNKGTLAKLQGFANLINGFIAKNLDESQNAYDTARHIIEGSQIPLVLASDNTPENISRQENINELLRSVRDFVDQKMEEGDDGIRLANYMAEVALQTDQDQTDDQGPCVTLMTAHAAKGLEFENVIIAGVEEDRFPSYRSKDRLEDIEEERRLLYVAITRAKRTCTIMHSDAIVLNGQTQPANPSRFLRDIDAQLLDVSSTSFQPAKPEPESWSSARNSWSAPARQSAMRVTPPPATMRRPASKPATTAPAGNFVTLTADDLHVGSRVAHNRFGHGEVVTIDTAADAKVVVNFENVGLKTLLLKFAKFQLIE